ncbi:MAG: hypothetical protein JWM28_3463 [Chitinophagaceae bacterium]|nr:hypothetical protein [Chitinophagaceae bacterium]
MGYDEAVTVWSLNNTELKQPVGLYFANQMQKLRPGVTCVIFPAGFNSIHG